MATLVAAFAGDSFGAPAGSHQYGPYTLENVVKIVRVECTMAFGNVGDEGAYTSTIEGIAVWGVQVGATGYTPQTLPGGLDSEQFFWAKLAGGSLVVNFSWAPSSDTGALIYLIQEANQWRGQVNFSETVDFYVTSGSLVEGPFSWVDSWTLRVTYTQGI